jgi:twinkle protein
MSEFQKHGPCEACGSSDGVGWYDDGHGVCFVCEKYYGSKDSNKKETRKLSEKPTGPITPVTTVFRAIPKRGLTEASIKKFSIDINMDKDKDVAHRYPYFKDGQHVANKVRKRSEKAFYWEGNPRNAELFGQHLFPAGSAKAVTVVEGELDAPSGWLLLGSRYPVVGLPSVGHAVAAVKTNFEYLNSFDEVVLCLDADEGRAREDGTVAYAGQDTAKKIAEMFAPGKCRILTLEHGKDPNEYLQNNLDPKVFTSEWWKAPRFRPDGLKAGSSMWDEIVNRPSHFSIPYPWGPLNSKTFGIRLSEAVLLMADTGVGKTSIFKEIEHHLLTSPEVIEKGYGVGVLHLEEPNFDTALGLMSIENDKPYHLPDTPKTTEELRSAFDKVLNNERAIFYDHFGSNEIDEILAKVRFMSVMGCKYIFIDHLSIIVSDQSGDERKQLDEISTKLKTLTMELNIAVFCVIHTNRDGQARGSAGPEKVANIHLSLHRDKKDPDPWRRNVLKIEIEKNRFSGRTGPCLWLFYDEITGRLVELDDVAITKYEEGLSINDSDKPF